ncbi:MAG TPA: hypothetical protein VIJ85_02975 [Rhizomicrobium sp.]
MTERRISAVLAILIGAIYAQGLYLGLRAFAWQHGSWRVLAIGALIPLVAGVFALAGRMTILLPIAWGWVLGVHLPKLLLPRPQMPPEVVARMAQSGAHVVAPPPDYAGMAMCAVAFIGLALYLYAWRRDNA